MLFNCVWRRLLRVPWTARRSNQSILKEINPDYSLEGLMLKLKLQYFGYLTDAESQLRKALILGKIEVRRRKDDRVRDGCIASLTQQTGVWASSRKRWTGKPTVLQSMGSKRVRHNWATALQQLHSNNI